MEMLKTTKKFELSHDDTFESKDNDEIVIGKFEVVGHKKDYNLEKLMNVNFQEKNFFAISSTK